ncbi:DUF3060 domain-containing protein [Amycolatopsis benzoatilytica]|uniref:DUF3060 domain-containing protein n=1 Tax=Amycolatopsis benzoatilytica TaxID=346045 RepID=UPI00036739D4|nr:DUF3060 domain-containing protein [Amycolatopsis benzoatilytica]
MQPALPSASPARANRPAPRIGAILATAGLTALLAAGCGSGEPAATPQPPAAPAAGQQSTPGGSSPAADTEEADTQEIQGQGEPLIVSEDGTSLTDNCKSRKVLVTASNVQLTLNGPCALLTVNGNGSVINIGSAQKIVTTGGGIVVRYASGSPRIVNKGGASVITQGGTATP